MKKIIFVILLLTFSASLSGQESDNGIRIVTTPFQFIFLDFPISIEKQFKRHAVGLTFSYRPDTKDEQEIDSKLGWSYTHENFLNHLYQAATFGINYKYYYTKSSNFYLDTRLFYRHWWFDNKHASYQNVETARFDGLRTERQNVFGLKLLIGKTFPIETNTRVYPVIDVYAGLGMRYKYTEFITQNGTVNDTYYEYLHEKDNYWPSILPSVHLGVRIGIGIK